MEAVGTSLGWRWGSQVVKSGISFCLVLLDLSNCSLAVSWLGLTLVTDPSLLFQGLPFLCWASLLQEEAQHFGNRRPPDGGAGSGWFSGTSHFLMSIAQPLPKRHCQAPTTTISKPPPQVPEKAESESSAPIAEGAYWHRRLPPLPSPRPWKLPSQPTWHDVGGVKRDYKCQVEDVAKDHPPPMPPFVLMCTGPIWR